MPLMIFVHKRHFLHRFFRHEYSATAVAFVCIVFPGFQKAKNTSEIF